MSFLVFIVAVIPGYAAEGNAAEGNALADNLHQRLIGKDFENVSVVLEGRRVIATYENRVYRYEIRAIKRSYGNHFATNRGGDGRYFDSAK
jgi:hypothetical protein